MNLKEDFYQKASSWWWSGRTDSDFPKSYIHEAVNCVDVERGEIPDLKKGQKGFGLMGYCCQEGVRRNNGRIGSAHGPRAIRTVLGPLANPVNGKNQIIDLGNFHCLNEDMESTQQLIGTQVFNLLSKGYFPIILGGGHDISYGNYQGIRKFLDDNHPNDKLGIINFDAHFDLRKPIDESNSGTPFFQIAKDQKEQGKEFHYICLGIQEMSNGTKLFDTAKELNVQYLTAEQMSVSNLHDIKKVVEEFLNQIDRLYVTIDLDGFSSNYAPGVSAPSPMGICPDVVIEVLKVLFGSGKIISTDIAELNPTFDRDHCTSRLAASLVHRMLMFQN